MNKKSAKLIRKGIIYAYVDIRLTDIIPNYPSLVAKPKNKLVLRAYDRIIERETASIQAIRQSLEEK